MIRNIEARIAAREKKYRSMADKFIDAVWVIDATTFDYLYISPDTYSLRGYTQEELIGSSIQRTLTPESLKMVLSMVSKAKEEFEQGIRKSYTAELEVYHKNGSKLWFEISAKLVKEKDEPLKIVGITRNIDQRKRAEKDRETLLEKLQNALKEKDVLLSELKRLEGLLPICSGCRRIRHTDNTWWPIEKYVEAHGGSEFSHTICPDCITIYYPGEEQGG